jgi:hypothetical protein
MPNGSEHLANFARAPPERFVTHNVDGFNGHGIAGCRQLTLRLRVAPPYNSGSRRRVAASQADNTQRMCSGYEAKRAVGHACYCTWCHFVTARSRPISWVPLNGSR